MKIQRKQTQQTEVSPHRAVTNCGELEGTFNMATTELPINVDKDDSPQPFSKNFDQFGNSSGFIFDVSLSTAIAADGKNEERAPKPKGPFRPKCWTR